MQCQLAGVAVVYHLQCYVKFRRGSSQKEGREGPYNVCMDRIVTAIRLGLARGEVYTLFDVYQRYSEMRAEFGVEPAAGAYRNIKSRLKENLSRELHYEIDFVQQFDATESQLIFPRTGA
jgi:hypothetical protein